MPSKMPWVFLRISIIRFSFSSKFFSLLSTDASLFMFLSSNTRIRSRSSCFPATADNERSSSTRNCSFSWRKCSRLSLSLRLSSSSPSNCLFDLDCWRNPSKTSFTLKKQAVEHFRCISPSTSSSCVRLMRQSASKLTLSCDGASSVEVSNWQCVSSTVASTSFSSHPRCGRAANCLRSSVCYYRWASQARARLSAVRLQSRRGEKLYQRLNMYSQRINYYYQCFRIMSPLSTFEHSCCQFYDVIQGSPLSYLFIRLGGYFQLTLERSPIEKEEV